jgi:hypothetical protein
MDALKDEDILRKDELTHTWNGDSHACCSCPRRHVSLKSPDVAARAPQPWAHIPNDLQARGECAPSFRVRSRHLQNVSMGMMRSVSYAQIGETVG